MFEKIKSIDKPSKKFEKTKLSFFGKRKDNKINIQNQLFGYQSANEISEYQLQGIGYQEVKTANVQSQVFGIQKAKKVFLDQTSFLGIQIAENVGDGQYNIFSGINIIYEKGTQFSFFGFNFSFSQFPNSQKGLFNYSNKSGLSLFQNSYFKLRVAKYTIKNSSIKELEEIRKRRPSLLNKLSCGFYFSISDLEKLMLLNLDRRKRKSK